MTPNRVNRAHWPTKKNRQHFEHFLYLFPVHGENGLGWPQMGPGCFFFLLIQTLPTFWAERIWILRIFILLMFWTPDFWISRSPDLQIWPGPGLGWARPGLSHLDQKKMIFSYKYWCWSSRPAVSCRLDESKCHQVCIFIHQSERRLPPGPFKAP